MVLTGKVTGTFQPLSVKKLSEEKVRKVSRVLLAGSLWSSLLFHSSNTIGRVSDYSWVQNNVQVKTPPEKLVNRGRVSLLGSLEMPEGIKAQFQKPSQRSQQVGPDTGSCHFA